MRSVVEEKGLLFNINYIFPLPETITSDYIRIKQILINLIGNAIKFTSQGNVTLQISFDPTSNKVVFEVIDTGIGMSKDQASHVFEEFSQAESSTARRFGGTGLGLSISNRLVRLLGGELRVESEQSCGSKFCFQIDTGKLAGKLCSTIPQMDKQHNDQTALAEYGLVRGKILLVDDTPDNISLITTYLENFGADVISACDGLEAVSLASKNTFDLILMDMQMPRMDGLEALTEIRKSGYTNPIAMLTANAMQSEKEKCMSAGCDDFLLKPIEMPELRRVISKFLKPIELLSTNDLNVEEITPYYDTSSKEIYSNLMGKSKKLDGLIVKFIEQLPDYINNIEKAASKDDMESVKYHSHRLRGVSGNFGYAELVNLCTEIEELIENHEGNGIMLPLKKFEEIHRRIMSGSEQLSQDSMDRQLKS